MLYFLQTENTKIYIKVSCTTSKMNIELQEVEMMNKRTEKALRYVNEYFSGTRYNPRLCLTVEEADVVSNVLPDPYFLKKGNLVSNEHLYMWKIGKI